MSRAGVTEPVTAGDLARFQDAVAEWIDANAERLEPFRAASGSAASDPKTMSGLRQLLHDAGWTRWGWPEDVGGNGGALIHRVIVSDQFLRRGYAVSEGFALVEANGAALMPFMSDMVHTSLLPRLLSGEETWCQAFSEYEAGSDLATVACSAEPDGGDWLVNGRKAWVAWADHSARCILLTRTGDPGQRHRSLTIFLVDLDTPGLTVTALPTLTGATEVAALHLDNVRIPDTRRVGEVDGGWAVAMHQFAYERSMVTWYRQSWLLGRLEDFVRTAPEQLVDPGQLGRAYTALLSLGGVAHEMLQRFIAGSAVGPEAAVVKLQVAAAEQAIYDLVKDTGAELLFGSEPSDHRWRSEYFYSRVATVYGGATEIQKNLVSRYLLRLPKGES